MLAYIQTGNRDQYWSHSSPRNPYHKCHLIIQRFNLPRIDEEGEIFNIFFTYEGSYKQSLLVFDVRLILGSHNFFGRKNT